MADVLLIYPAHRMVLAGRTYSPLGLVYVAAMLEKEGFKVRVVDMEIEKMGPTEIGNLLAIEKPKVIGINTLTTSLPDVHTLIGFLRRKIKATIVVGGSHITTQPSAVAELEADYGIRGEGEYSFLKLCRIILRGEGDLKAIDGLVVNRSEGLEVKRPAFVEDLDGLPLPSRHLIKTSQYLFNTVLTSRGCPFNCIFCADVSTKVRSRTPRNVLPELGQLVRQYGISRIDFADSVFTLSRERAMEFCGEMMKSGLSFRWSCLTRCDLVDEELLLAMKAAGCFLILFGVESGVQDIRYRVGKRIDDATIRGAFRLCDKAGIKTGVSVMFGYPDETLEDMRKTIDFACGLNATYGVFSPPELLPGTRLFEIAVEEGFADENIWRDYMLGKIPNLYYTPKGVTFQQVYEILIEAHRRFYCNLPYVLKRIAGTKSKIETGETLDTIKHYLLDKISMTIKPEV